MLVTEDPGGALDEDTTYTYDVRDNLLTVSQGVQVRTFIYDRLSRLLTAANPESGTITYTYDDNGNVETRADARGITATYGYDALNQLTLTSYSDSSESLAWKRTPWVTRTYGTGTLANDIGRLTSVQNGDNYRYYFYDKLGRVNASTQAQVGEPQYDFGYTYNLDGSTETLTYPDGKVVAYDYDDAGRPKTAGLTTVGATQYLSAAAYAPHGAPTSMSLGNGLIETTTYNNRLQPLTIDATGNISAFVKIGYEWSAAYGVSRERSLI